MFERFTDRSRRVLVLAQEEAAEAEDSHIGTEHLLLGLIREGEGVGAEALKELGLDLDTLRKQVKAFPPTDSSEVVESALGAPPFTARCKKTLELSLREALQLGHNYIGTEHMLLGIVREGEGIGAQALEAAGADLSRVRQTVINLLSGYAADAQPPKWQIEREETAYMVEIEWPAGTARYRVKDSDRLIVAKRLEDVARALRGYSS